MTALRRFAEFGAPTVETVEHGITYLANQFWTAGQRCGHSLHEISYRACFKPPLCRFFLDLLSRPGATVYDPFMGRGTTVVEAALQGCMPLGNDRNPLSPMLVRPRLATPSLAAVAERLALIAWNPPANAPAETVAPADLLEFFHPDTLAALRALKAWLATRQDAGVFDAIDDWIRMVALNRLSGHSPGFFSVYTLPPNQACSARAQRRINTRRRQTPPVRDVPALVLRKSRALLADGGLTVTPPAALSTCDAWHTPEIAGARVDLVITSPPFLDVVDYVGDNWLRGWLAGLELTRVPFAQHDSLAAWQAMMRNTLAELARLVRPGGWVCVETGAVRKNQVLLDQAVWHVAESLPYQRVGVLVNAAPFSKTAHIWGITNNHPSNGTNTNRVVLLQRSKE